MMKHMLITNWDLALLRGIMAILFGIATLVLPGGTLIVLVVLFGAYALIGGIITTVMAIKDRKVQSDWWLWLLQGLVSIGAGVVTFVWPGITAMGLLYLIVAWAIANGILEIMLAIELRKVIKGEWLLVLDGILSVAFGVVCMFLPAAGALSILGLIGIYAIVYGASMVVLALRLRKVESKVEQLLAGPQAHTS
jgi:uncharacterized membrane protein HdeD (DUF308 family)